MTNDLSATPESSSPLIQRLERRHTEPVGLVNSLNWNPSGVKIPQAIVQRAALVQQLQTRYGTHSNEVAESELVLPNLPIPEVPNNTLSTVASSIAAMKQEGRREDNQEGFHSQVIEYSQNPNSTKPTAQSTSSITPSSGGQFRVSRKAIPKINHMDASTTIQAKFDTSKAVNSSFPATDEMPLATAVKTQLQPSQISPIEQPPLLQMKAASTASLPLSPAELIQRSPANTSLYQFEKRMRQMNSQKRDAESNSQSKIQNLKSKMVLPVVSELPLSSPLLQRTNDEDVVDLGYIDFPRLDYSTRANAQPANLAQENGYVSIQGIEANYARTNPRPENTPAALPLNTGSVRESISQVAPSVTAHQPLSTEVVVPVMPSQHLNSSIPEVDVAQVAEQVSRILFRQLRIERERRGFGR
jgi:hypothetical protein